MQTRLSLVAPALLALTGGVRTQTVDQRIIDLEPKFAALFADPDATSTPTSMHPGPTVVSDSAARSQPNQLNFGLDWTL